MKIDVVGRIVRTIRTDEEWLSIGFQFCPPIGVQF
jgi:hypothetical protein